MEIEELYELLTEANREQNQRFDSFCNKTDRKLDTISNQLREMNGRTKLNALSIRGLWGVFGLGWTVFYIWLRGLMGGK